MKSKYVIIDLKLENYSSRTEVSKTKFKWSDPNLEKISLRLD